MPLQAVCELQPQLAFARGKESICHLVYKR